MYRTSLAFFPPVPPVPTYLSTNQPTYLLMDKRARVVLPRGSGCVPWRAIRGRDSFASHCRLLIGSYSPANLCVRVYACVGRYVYLACVMTRRNCAPSLIPGVIRQGRTNGRWPSQGRGMVAVGYRSEATASPLPASPEIETAKKRDGRSNQITQSALASLSGVCGLFLVLSRVGGGGGGDVLSLLIANILGYY